MTQSTSKQCGSDAVLRMRDEFLQLVAAYNAVSAYEAAMDAQAIAIALHKFEDKHVITDIEWPARVVGEGIEAELAGVERERT